MCRFTEKQGGVAGVHATGLMLQVPASLYALGHPDAASFAEYIVETAGASVQSTLSKISPSGGLSTIGDASVIEASTEYLLGVVLSASYPPGDARMCLITCVVLQ